MFKTLTIFLFFISPAALAQWVKYEESTKLGFEAFYAPLSITPQKNLRSVLILKNYNKSKSFDAEKPYFEYKSTVSTQLINCDDNTYKNNRIQIWTAHNGKGKLKKDYSYENKENWIDVNSGSIQEALHQKICLTI